jgi:hypothetical protein
MRLREAEPLRPQHARRVRPGPDQVVEGDEQLGRVRLDERLAGLRRHRRRQQVGPGKRFLRHGSEQRAALCERRLRPALGGEPRLHDRLGNLLRGRDGDRAELLQRRRVDRAQILGRGGLGFPRHHRG